MQKTISILITLVVILIAMGCTAGGGISQNGVDTLYFPRHADRFIIFSRGDTIILSVRNPWQGAENTEKSYVITKPLERIITTSTSHLAFLEALDCSRQVVGVSGMNYIYSDAYASAADIGYDRSLEYERILSLGSDAMTVYEVAGESSTVFGKLESLGVNVIYIADYLENNPLGRAEWIVAFGALTGKLQQARDYFDRVESAYDSLKVEKGASGRKVILNSPYRDTWYFPGTDSYPVRLIEDAGGEYIGESYRGDRSVPVSMETAYRHLLKADIWLNPSIGTGSMADLQRMDARLSGIDIPLYNFDKRSTKAGGTDYFETGVVRPDLILRDLKHILSGIDEDSLFFYRRIN